MCTSCCATSEGEINFEDNEHPIYCEERSAYPCLTVPQRGKNILLGSVQLELESGKVAVANEAITTFKVDQIPDSPSDPDASCETVLVETRAPTDEDVETPTTADNPVVASTPSPQLSVDEFSLRISGSADCQHSIRTVDSQKSDIEHVVEVVAPNVRAQLPAKDLRAVEMLEAEFNEDEIHTIRQALVPGEAMESFFLRFSNGCHKKPRAAAKAIRTMLDWRHKVAPLHLTQLNPGTVCGCANELIEQFMPTWHEGYDRQGRPLIFTHYGKFRFGPILEAGVTIEKILDLHVRNSERTAQLCGQQSYMLGRDISNALIVMDTEGWDSQNLRTSGALQWARGIARIDQEYYPERMGKLFIINAPPSVFYFYKLVSWLIPEKARNQVKIFAGREQWVPALLEHIDASELPPQYGGCKV